MGDFLNSDEGCQLRKVSGFDFLGYDEEFESLVA